jgi:octaprenyl-diphosphate synthase
MSEPATTRELKDILKPVEDDIKAVAMLLDELLRPPTEQVRAMVEHVKAFRGKMLRPALTMFAGRCFDEIGEDHIKLGAVVELIHTATLVHDDVLDSADIRRGLETVSRKWDTETAILLGDYLFATAFGLSASLENPLAARYLSWVTGIVCQGEIAQTVEQGNLELTEELYLDVIEKKTAYLFAGSARVGAEYAGASEQEAGALTDYGMKLGAAFQIIDDCLDLDGEEERVGKTLGTDAGQGKVTLPVLQYLRTSSEADAAHMRELLTSGDPAVRDDVRELLVSSGALQYARDRANQFAAEAERSISGLPDTPAKASLAELAQYTLARKR